MKKYKFLGIVFGVLIMSFSLLAQLPEADAVYESILEEYTLNDDGSVDHHFYKKMNYLTHSSFNRYFGETFVVYNPDYQTLNINKSQTIQIGGKVIKTPENAFNEVLPRFANNAPYYNHLKEMVITHTGLEIGAGVELDYTIHSEAGYYPALSGEINLEQVVPVGAYFITISIPKGKAFSYKVSNKRTAPTITEQGDRVIYEFKFYGLNSLKNEVMRPNASAYTPTLSFDFVGINDTYKKIVGMEAFKFSTNKKMAAYISSLKKDSKNEMDIILAIQNFIANEINTYHIPFEYAVFSSRTAEEVWNANGGSIFEKSILMTSLLRIAGINAYPVFVLSEAFQEGDPFALEMLSDMMVQINPREISQLYLSPVRVDKQNQIYDLEIQKLVVLNPDKEASILSFEITKSTISFTGNFELSDSLTFNGEIQIKLMGEVNPSLSIMKDSTYAKTLLAGGMGKSDIEAFEVQTNSLRRSDIQYKVHQTKKPDDLNGYYFIDLPMLNCGFESWKISYLNTQRIHPMVLPYIIEENYNMEIKLPSKLKLINPVEDYTLETDFGSITINIQQEGDILKVMRSLKLNSRRILQDRYFVFKTLIDAWNLKKYKELVFKFEE